MLHTLHRSAWLTDFSSLLRLIDKDDELLLLQDGVTLNICVAAALRRGVVDETEAKRLGLAGANLQSGFNLSGLGSLAEASLTCDRVVQF